MAKEGYKPTAGMQSAARRAIKLKEQGKAKGAGTAVGWTRAGQLSRGETLSLSTVKRMYSFFSRCLLYTSPSPRDRQKSRMPSSA